MEVEQKPLISPETIQAQKPTHGFAREVNEHYQVARQEQYELEAAPLTAIHSPMLCTLLGMERRLDALIRQQRHVIQHMHDLSQQHQHSGTQGANLTSHNLILMDNEMKVEIGGELGMNIPSNEAMVEKGAAAQSNGQDQQRKNLAVNVFLTHFNQIPSYHCDNVNSIDPPHWSLRIEGRILDDKPEIFPRFLNFFKRIFIDVSVGGMNNTNNGYNNNFDGGNIGNDLNLSSSHSASHYFEWTNEMGAQYDGLEIHCTGDQEGVATIYLFPSHLPEHYRVQASLCDALGLIAENNYSLAQLITAFWSVVKTQGLSYTPEEIFLDPNSALATVFGRSSGDTSLNVSELPSLLQSYFSAPEPLQIVFPIVFRHTLARTQEIMPVEVPWDCLLVGHKRLQPTTRALKSVNEKIVTLTREFADRDRKRKYLQSFADSPADMMDRARLNYQLYEPTYDSRMKACHHDTVDEKIQHYLSNLESGGKT